MIHKMLLTSLFAGTLIISGCASVPMADAEKDATAKTFTVKPGKANIYLYRDETIAASIKMDVSLDGQPIGQTVYNSFLLAEVNPGNHKISSEAENTSTVDILAEEGKNYYVWQEVKMGVLLARNGLQIVDVETGKKGVLECRLIK